MKKLLSENKRSLLFFIIPFIIIIIKLPELPTQIPIHFDAHFEPDHYIHKSLFLFFPIFFFFLHLFTLYIEEKKGDSQNFHNNPWLKWLIPSITLIVTLISMAYALTQNDTLLHLMPFGLAILFIVIGNILPTLTQNKTIGIKIPPTLRDPENWYLTHRFTSILWVSTGTLLLLGLIVSPMASSFFLLVLVLNSSLPIAYSYYLMFQRRKKNG